MAIDDDDRAALAGAEAPRSDDPRGDDKILPKAHAFQSSFIDWGHLWTLVAALVVGSLVALVQYLLD